MSVKGIVKRFVSLLQPKTIVTASFNMVKHDSLFSDKVVLVTGGGSGFGYAIANRFISLGAKVIITGRNEEKLKKVNELKMKLEAQIEIKAGYEKHYS